MQHTVCVLRARVAPPATSAVSLAAADRAINLAIAMRPSPLLSHRVALRSNSDRDLTFKVA